MGVAYFRNQPSGCYWYRIKRPMDMLASHGFKTTGISLNEDIETDGINSFLIYGAYPFSVKDAFAELKKDGKKIVLDMDDALELVDDTNPLFYSVKKDLGSHRELISLADEITVSTPVMAEYAKARTDKPVTIIPNCFTESEWIYPRTDRKGIRIGFAGASAHVSDLIPILPIIKRLQDKYDITFVLFGFGLSNYQNWYYDQRFAATEAGKKDLELFNELLLPIKYEWVPYQAFEDYPSTLINIALDIGIAPLAPTSFNKHRSACKAMEYTLSGALCLASDMEPYRVDKSSVLVSVDKWETELEYYITHPEERKSIQQGHLKWIKDNRNIESQLELLKKVYGL